LRVAVAIKDAVESSFSKSNLLILPSNLAKKYLFAALPDCNRDAGNKLNVINVLSHFLQKLPAGRCIPSASVVRVPRVPFEGSQGCKLGTHPGRNRDCREPWKGTELLKRLQQVAVVICRTMRQFTVTKRNLCEDRRVLLRSANNERHPHLSLVSGRRHHWRMDLEDWLLPVRALPSRNGHRLHCCAPPLSSHHGPTDAVTTRRR
jgi:hypothetical protein